MLKTKFIISPAIIIIFLIFTSIVKNKSRVLEKKITNLNSKIISKENNLNEAQLDFYYLSSPAEIEKKLNMIGFDNYQPIVHSKIFLKISDFTEIENKVSTFKNINEKKIKKKQ